MHRTVGKCRFHKESCTADGAGGSIEVTDEINTEAIDAIVAAVRGTPQKSEARQKLHLHQHAVTAAKAPSERGAVFQVPRLCRVIQGELEVVDHGTRQGNFPWEPLDRGALPDDFTWNLLAHPPELASFRFLSESMTFEVDLAGEGAARQVTYRQVKDDTTAYLPGFAQDRSETDLVGWLDQEVRDASVRQPVLREWLRSAVRGLLADRGFSLAQLFKGRFVLRRKLVEQLQLAREQAIQEGFQQALFGGDPELIATLDEPALNFSYSPDMTRYPARRYYEGSYRFQKHYYPRPGDLDWKTPAGRVTEEFECAQAIDLLDAVEYWVRNVVHGTQFWLPTARQRTYPDFVAKLRDGRLFVVEYKGGDRFSSDPQIQPKPRAIVPSIEAARAR